MSAKALKDAFRRAKSDTAFFSALLRDPRGTLSSEAYDVTEDELTRLEMAVTDARVAGDALRVLLEYADAGSMDASLINDPPWGWDA